MKRRQAGSSVVDIFCKEFSSRNREYYEQAFRDGRLRIEGPVRKKVTYDFTTPLSEGVRIRHLVHRHEPPVPNAKVELIEEDDDYFVVCKPAGMPVHSGGQYRKNTVMGLIEAGWPGLARVSPAHRLDRPVSGVLICTKNKATARNVLEAITSGETKKLYIARVLGKVEQEAFDVDAPLYYDFGQGKALIGIEGVDIILADKPMNEPEGRRKQLKGSQGNEEDHDKTGSGTRTEPADAADAAEASASKHQHHRTTKRVKKDKLPKHERVALYHEKAAKHQEQRIFRPARTLVRLLGHSKDGKTSLVECQPVTGRTHQIRAHLAHIGHPIANDGSYGGTIDGHRNTGDIARSLGLHRRLDEPSPDTKEAFLNGSTLIKVDAKVPEELIDASCPHCPYYVARDYPVDWTPLWLHARWVLTSNDVISLLARPDALTRATRFARSPGSTRSAAGRLWLPARRGRRIYDRYNTCLNQYI